MSKVSIVYWSGTGNTAMMAGSIAVNGTPGPDAEDELKSLGQTLESL